MVNDLLIRAVYNATVLAVFYSIIFILLTPYRKMVSKQIFFKLASFIFIGTLPLMYLPVGSRLFYFFAVCVTSNRFILKHNWIQSMYLSFLVTTIASFTDGIATLAGGFMLGFNFDVIGYGFTWQFGVFTFAAQLLLLFIISRISKNIRQEVAKKHFLNRNQFIISGFSIFTLLLYVVTMNYLQLVNPMASLVLQTAVMVIFTALGGIIFVMMYKNYRKSNQYSSLSKLSEAMHMSSEQLLELEADLYQSIFGSQIFSEYVFEDVLHIGTQSTIFLLIGSDGLKYTLKATRNHGGEIIFSKDSLDRDNKYFAPILLKYTSEKYIYTVKPYVEGVDLSQMINEQGVLHEDRARHLIKELCHGIMAIISHYGHAVHRDIKPENIVLSYDGEVKLIDIETMRSVKEDQASDTVLIASRGYTAPEQFGFSQSDMRSDIYAIGATLYYLLVGETPDYNVVHDDKFAEKWKWSKEILEIIRTCMRFDPAERFSSVDELLERI